MGKFLLIGFKCLVGLFLSGFIYILFLDFYKSYLIQQVHNPFIGLIVLIGVLLVLLIVGLVFSFKFFSILKGK